VTSSSARYILADDNIYYELLEVDRNASEEDIKKAYRKLAFLYNPDRHPGNEEALKQFKLISRAYEYLLDRAKQSQGEIKEEDFRSPPSRSRPRSQHSAEGEPRCPGCSITGMDRISAKNGGGSAADGKRFISAPFIVVFCDNCGHVYAVIRS
jgi:curved DNA-binding protein CbpA